MAIFERKSRFHELRASPRHDVHYLAHIDLGAGMPMLSCIICDISGTGAKLTIGQRDVPEEFTLVFRRRCKVVRQSDGQIGVRFVQST
jgi:hypothetical protein